MSRSSAVLLVEDDPAQRQEMSDLVAAWGYRIDSAADGDEALSLAVAGSYAAILMDIGIPGPSGIETARRLVSCQPGATVVFLSDDGPRLREAAREPGLALVALPKPVSVPVLRATLAILCGEAG